MYDFLKEFSELSEWNFEYGRADFNNLFEASEVQNKIHIFLDPVTTEKKKNDSGVVEKITYSGSFMMLYSSNIDEQDYEYRYLSFIKPIIDVEVEKFEDYISCEKEVDFEQWKINEIINMFDYNFDGIIVTYRISIDV